jgi:hypothetical protein
MLRHAGGLLHFRGEINPYLWLCELTHPWSGHDSDVLTPADFDDPAVRARIDRELSFDCGQPDMRLDTPESRDRFAFDLAIRLTIQWPGAPFRWESVRRWMEETLQRLQRDFGWTSEVFGDATLFHALFLSKVRAHVAEVNPYNYDLPLELIQEHCPSAALEEGPQTLDILEVPPYLALLPWRLPTRDDLATRPLVIKTTTNAFRLAGLRQLFQNAKFRILHLTRNAASVINGLYDAWRYHGFYYHWVPETLNIQGYSDVFPEWGDHWWKFDSPPGWQAHVDEPLEDVCAFQWNASHCAILDFLSENPEVDALQVRFEDVVASPEKRQETFDQVFRWLGVEMDYDMQRVAKEGLRPVFATRPPRKARWRDRFHLLKPLTDHPEIADTMERLGYEPDHDSWH